MARSMMVKHQIVARMAAALTTIGAMIAAPGMIAWLEAAYPMNQGPLASALVYSIAAFVAWLVVVFMSIAWLWPSWVLASWIRPADQLEARALRATVIAFLLQPAIHARIIVGGGRDLAPDRYRLVVIAVQGVMLCAAAIVNTRRSSQRPAPSRNRLAVLCGVTLAVTVILVSRLAWADLNPDGTELVTMGRSLASFVMPRLPTGEIPGVNLGMLTVAYPIDWLLAIAGLSPFAARLPAIAYIALIGVGLSALVEHGARRRLSTTEFALLLAGATAVCLTIGFNASYDPYSTDLASPASIDLLALVFLVATLYFLFAGEAAWCVAASVLLALSRPSAVLLSLMTVTAIVLVERDLRSRQLRLALLATVTTLLVSVFYVFAIESVTGSQVSEGGGNLLLRVRFLRFDDWGRLAYFIVPSGILPVALMWRWRQFDQRGVILALVATAYFAFFYGLAFISLHHFAPAMLLPLAVFWRHEAQREAATRSPMRAALAAGLVIAVIAALPRAVAPFRGSRDIGKAIAFDVGDVRGYSLIRNTFDASRALDSLFAPYWSVKDPAIERVGDPLSLAWYAAKAKPNRDSAQYVVQREGLAAPAGTTLLGTARGFALYAREVTTWHRQRNSPPPADTRSRLYDVPRTTLFQHLGRDAGIVQVDLKELACGVLRAMPPCASTPAGPGS